MSCLALAPNQLVPTNTLAAMTQVPSNYLAKVLQILANAQLITGRRGVGGGYKLARSATEIRLVEIINTVGELKRIETCPLGLVNHGSNLCPLHRTMDRAAATLIEMLDNVTLQNLVDDPRTPNKPMCDSITMAALTVGGALPVRNDAKA
jgi:Rrf2 family protein